MSDSRIRSPVEHLNNYYGGKKAWVRTHTFRLLDHLSMLPASSRTDRLSDIRRIIFACKGNLCRSPYAEARARQLGITSASFGLDAHDGAPANPDAVRVARERGLDLGSHIATHLSAFSFEAGDLILVFEPAQFSRLVGLRILPADVSADLLGRWCCPHFPYLHDPYGLSDAYFNNCFDRIDQALNHLACCFHFSFTKQ